MKTSTLKDFNYFVSLFSIYFLLCWYTLPSGQIVDALLVSPNTRKKCLELGSGRDLGSGRCPKLSRWSNMLVWREAWINAFTLRETLLNTVTNCVLYEREVVKRS